MICSCTVMVEDFLLHCSRVVVCILLCLTSKELVLVGRGCICLSYSVLSTLHTIAFLVAGDLCDTL